LQSATPSSLIVAPLWNRRRLDSSRRVWGRRGGEGKRTMVRRRRRRRRRMAGMNQNRGGKSESRGRARKSQRKSSRVSLLETDATNSAAGGRPSLVDGRAISAKRCSLLSPRCGVRRHPRQTFVVQIDFACVASLACTFFAKALDFGKW
jgi:hypothetical protein